MAYYNKIGLLVLNDDQTKFLVCQKAPENVTADYIMPGGQLEEASIEECLEAEIEEELSCGIDLNSLEYIDEFTDVAAGRPDRDVSIKLYKGKLIGEPKPSTEIKILHWIGSADKDNPLVSPIIRNKIIPGLEKKGILK
ncbi:NUDIX domain-containing protein [Patescibacteria group bacterium]